MFNWSCELSHWLRDVWGYCTRSTFHEFSIFIFYLYHNSGQNWQFFVLRDLEIWWMILENNRTLLQYHIKLCESFQIQQWIETGVTVQKRRIWVKIGYFLSPVTLKFDGWPWKTIGHLFYTMLSFVHHFIAIGEFKLKLQTGNAQFGSKLVTILSHVSLEFDWEIILKDNSTPLLCCFKICASFNSHHWIKTGVTVLKRPIWVKIDDFFSHATLKFDRWSCHMWIQTGVTVRKGLSWVLTSVTLTFDLWPWPFAWTSPLSMVMTPENFRMIQWQEHCQKGVTDGRTEGRTDRQRRTERSVLRAAWSQLKRWANYGTSYLQAVGWITPSAPLKAEPQWT